MKTLKWFGLVGAIVVVVVLMMSTIQKPTIIAKITSPQQSGQKNANDVIVKKQTVTEKKVTGPEIRVVPDEVVSMPSNPAATVETMHDLQYQNGPRSPHEAGQMAQSIVMGMIPEVKALAVYCPQAVMQEKIACMNEQAKQLMVEKRNQLEALELEQSRNTVP